MEMDEVITEGVFLSSRFPLYAYLARVMGKMRVEYSPFAPLLY